MQKNQHIEFQHTQPLPGTVSKSNMTDETDTTGYTGKPTLCHLRKSCRMSRQQLAKAAGVRLCFVDWMERGIQVSQSDALKVLLALSQRTGCWYRIEDIGGLHIRHDATH